MTLGRLLLFAVLVAVLAGCQYSTLPPRWPDDPPPQEPPAPPPRLPAG